MKTIIVTIHKVELSTKNWVYNIYDEEEQEYIDGFRRKWQAIDAIERWGLIRKDKKVKVIYY
jgi:hypothetical protein